MAVQSRHGFFHVVAPFRVEDHKPIRIGTLAGTAHITLVRHTVLRPCLCRLDGRKASRNAAADDQDITLMLHTVHNNSSYSYDIYEQSFMWR